MTITTEGNHHDTLATLAANTTILGAPPLLHQLHVGLHGIVPTNNAVAIRYVNWTHSMQPKCPTGNRCDNLGLHSKVEEDDRGQVEVPSEGGALGCQLLLIHRPGYQEGLHGILACTACHGRCPSAARALPPRRPRTRDGGRCCPCRCATEEAVPRCRCRHHSGGRSIGDGLRGGMVPPQRWTGDAAKRPKGKESDCTAAHKRASKNRGDRR
mmetsp:Transcript_131071/g.327003  ORF Transcript_131071/g.327003 Transcript_131071/m.327003 type:complete len:212 (-) Transcript_131071:130-765(-)